MMDAEQVMKQALDGCFFVIHPITYATQMKRVPLNHIPNHKPRFNYDEEAQPVRGRQWTEADDAILIKMFEAGHTFSEMGKVVKASQSAVNVRWRELCIAKGIKNERRSPLEKYAAELYPKVAHMKTVDQLTFRQIALKLNMTPNQIAGIWRRWRKNGEQMEQAA